MRARSTDRWDARPALSRSVRLAVLLVPLLVSVLAAVVLVSVLPHPSTTVARVAWWVAVLGGALLAAQLVERVARRALPLAALLRLSLVFPDRAPSRLRAARRTSLREIERQVAALQEVDEPSEAARTLVSLVGALGLHDKRTRGHSERVRAYVDLLTEELGLPEHDRVRLRWAALIHDVGKLTVPGSVLNGGRDLGAHDWDALRAHPEEGERIAGALLPWLGEWGRCVREHHERWDGHGYPLGLAGEQISRGARIVAVADAYEVMTANRSYQRAVSPAAARVELLRCAGSDFDPAVVRAFLQVSLGRLRGVLGPFGFLPAVPFAFARDRVGDAFRGVTTVAAATAVGVALATSVAPVAGPLPAAPLALGGGTPVVLPPAPLSAGHAAVLLPVRREPASSTSPAPVLPASARSRAALAAAPVARPDAAPTPGEASTPSPAATPSGATPSAVPVLYLGPHGALVTQRPAGGSVTLQPGAAAAVFGDGTSSGLVVRGTPVVTLVVELQPWHGQGHPPSSVTAVLQDCAATCRTLSSGTAGVPQRTGPQQVALVLPAVSAVVPAGHELVLALSAGGATDVRSLTVHLGPSTLRVT